MTIATALSQLVKVTTEEGECNLLTAICLSHSCFMIMFVRMQLTFVSFSIATDPVQVATLASSLSPNCEGVKLVKYIAERMTILAPQVVNAAETLASSPGTKPAKDNLAAFKDFWDEMVEGMMDAVDITVSIQDFMAVSGKAIMQSHMLCAFMCLGY